MKFRFASVRVIICLLGNVDLSAWYPRGESRKAVFLEWRNNCCEGLGHPASQGSLSRWQGSVWLSWNRIFWLVGIKMNLSQIWSTERYLADKEAKRRTDVSKRQGSQRDTDVKIEVVKTGKLASLNLPQITRVYRRWKSQGPGAKSGPLACFSLARHLVSTRRQRGAPYP